MAQPIDAGRVREALAFVERDQLTDAMEMLGPIVRGKRFTRPSGITAEPLEVSEVKAWLQAAINDRARTTPASM